FLCKAAAATGGFLLFSPPVIHPVSQQPSHPSFVVALPRGGVPCPGPPISIRNSAFEPMSKRRRSFPSESRVKRGLRIVGHDKELVEKLGRNDLCPCGSRRRFQEMLPEDRSL